MLRDQPFVEGEVYHLYNRGVDKRDIFLDFGDHERFLKLLFACNDEKSVNIHALYEKGRTFNALVEATGERELLVDIGAWCLMPNHFHLMVRERAEGGITEFMRKLSTGYTMYFNKKYERSGALFEGKFKSKHVGEEGYFHWLFSYIHLNPVKIVDPEWKEKGISEPERVADYLRSYQWSSYQDYFGQERPEKAILNREEFPDYFKDFDDARDIIEEFSEHRAEFDL